MSIKQLRSSTHLSLKRSDYRNDVKRFVIDSFRADVKNEGDITSQALCGRIKIIAEIISKEEGIIAGIEEIDFSIKNWNKNIHVIWKKKTGDIVKKGQKVGILEGCAKDILEIERTVLNVLQRMSAIATQTHRLSQKVKKYNPSVTLAATRKTVMGLLDKRAVEIGSGFPHRANLNDAFLVKDTHMTIFKNDIEKIFEKIQAFQKKRKNKKASTKSSRVKFLEIEVETKEQIDRLKDTLKKTSIGLPIIVMFDNMKPKDIKNGMRKLKTVNLANVPLFKNGLDDLQAIYFEASGGIHEKNIEKYAKTGVDIISLGMLTQAVPVFDISLEVAKSY